MKPDSKYTEIHINRQGNGQHDKCMLWQNKNTSLTGYHQHWCTCTLKLDFNVIVIFKAICYTIKVQSNKYKFTDSGIVGPFCHYHKGPTYRFVKTALRSNRTP